MLYSNENFPMLVVEELRQLGHDVLTVLEAGKANQAIEDEEVLAYAAGLERMVLTPIASTSFDSTVNSRGMPVL